MSKVERWLGGRLKDIRAFIEGLYEHDLHAKRVDALAGATLGVMTSASLAVAVIGQALAQARGLVTKHAIKQVDRLLSNQNIDVWDSFARWVPHLIGARKEIVVAMDWTEFDRDGQATLALNLVTGHGRATPLLWVTVWKEELSEQRNDFEDACLLRLKQLVPPDCAVRWTIEPNFRDTKDLRFGIGLGATRIGHQRVRHGAADHARRRRRKPRNGPIAQVQYVENPHALIVQAGLHALRTHPNHAGSQTISAHGPLRRDRIKVPLVQRTFRGHLK